MLQLNPPLWFTTPKGLALCHFVIDYGIEHDLLWVCFQQDTGECWTWENSDVRICDNASIKRNTILRGRPELLRGVQSSQRESLADRADTKKAEKNVGRRRY